METGHLCCLLHDPQVKRNSSTESSATTHRKWSRTMSTNNQKATCLRLRRSADCQHAKRCSMHTVRTRKAESFRSSGARSRDNMDQTVTHCHGARVTLLLVTYSTAQIWPISIQWNWNSGICGIGNRLNGIAQTDAYTECSTEDAQMVQTQKADKSCTNGRRADCANTEDV